MIDEQLFLLIHGLAGKSSLLDLLGIFLADYLGYFLFLTALLLFWTVKNWRQRSQYFLFAALALILSRGLLTEIIRFFYFRPRPFVVLEFTPLISQEAIPAFPSGHAAFYFALAISVYYLLSRSWGWRLAVGAALIGLARIFVGVHWPLDILAGFLAALISVWLVAKFIPK